MIDSEPTQVCPNCNEIYAQKSHYCPNCGQHSQSSVITFKEAFSDLLSSLVSFDSKVFTTIPRLLFFPGRLTKEYLEGKRASQLSPFRLYLFLSVILILLLSLVMNEEEDSIFQVNTEQSQKVTDSLNNAIQLEFNDPADSTSETVLNTEFENNILSLIAVSNQLLKEGFTLNEVFDSILVDRSFITRIIVKQTLKYQQEEGKGMFHVFLKTSSYAMFFFLPLFALILKLLYFRRKRFYIEHFIFTLHFFSFIFFVLMFFVLLNLLPVDIPRWIMLFLILIYLFISMLRVYQQSWRKTLLKAFTLIMATTIFIGPLLVILVSLF